MKRCMTMGLVLAVLMTTGCLEREETITVEPDGAVTMTVIVRADEEKELAPGRIPAPGAGWQVQRSQEPQKDGKVKYVVTAVQEFAPGAALPSVDGDPDDPDRDLYVQYPTTVTVEQREDGTYCHFRRVYPARSFAQYHGYEDVPQRGQVDQIMEKDRADVTDNEWRLAVNVMIEVNARQKLALARRAALAVTPDLPQDRWLAVYDKVMTVGDELDMAAVLRMLRDNDEAGLAAEADRFDQRLSIYLDDAMVMMAGYSGEQMDAFRAELARAERRQRITDEAQGLGCTIRLSLPGEIVGSNATESNGGVLTWKFSGKWMLDRDMELLASSRVPRKD